LQRRRRNSRISSGKLVNKLTPQEAIKEFEDMRYMAELRALSKVSLERPLNDDEFNRMMELKDRFGL